MSFDSYLYPPTKYFLYFYSSDSLTIANDTNHIYGKYCGEKSGQTVSVTGHYAVLTFLTDSAVTERGFLLAFTPVPLGE